MDGEVENLAKSAQIAELITTATFITRYNTTFKDPSVGGRIIANEAMSGHEWRIVDGG